MHIPESLEPLGIQETKDILKLGIRTEERSIELYSKSVEKTDNKSSKDLFSRLVLFETSIRKHSRMHCIILTRMGHGMDIPLHIEG